VLCRKGPITNGRASKLLDALGYRLDERNFAYAECPSSQDGESAFVHEMDHHLTTYFRFPTANLPYFFATEF
jgi:hypothetical protein